MAKDFWIIAKTPRSLPASQSGHATSSIEFFAHLLISGDPDRHQNLISSSWYHFRPLHKISLQSVYNVLSNVAHKHRQTHTTKTITSFAKD